jgi:SAM-dependent methyltransferase
VALIEREAFALGEFVIPLEFNRNHVDVQALGSPALTGQVLLDYMAKRIGWESLAGKTVLDIGCGTRFVSAIRTYEIPIGRYIGVDVNRPIIDWLKANAAFPEFEFHCIDQENPMYNPGGDLHAPDWSFVSDVDVLCMFSVITHQLPPAASGMFREAHKRVRDRGFLFFSADIRPDGPEYMERLENVTGLSSYREDFVRQLLSEAGWHVTWSNPPRPTLPEYPIAFVPIASHFVCQKVI